MAGLEGVHSKKCPEPWKREETLPAGGDHGDDLFVRLLNSCFPVDVEHLIPLLHGRVAIGRLQGKQGPRGECV